MTLELVEYQPEAYSEKIRPLKYGQPVALLVDDPNTMKKRRIGKPVLFITPSSLYGLGAEYLVFALQGHGCEVMHRHKLKKLYLTRLGLSMKAAKLLINELNALFSIEEKTDEKV